MPPSSDEITCSCMQGHLKNGQESSSKFVNFSVNKYAKSELELFVAMPCKLLTKFQLSKLLIKFQLNIFIFEARASL